MNAEKTKIVDHINGNTLDNRESNLRVCTHSDNCKNRKMHSNNKTGFKGVSLKDGKYVAQIQFKGNHKHLGLFDTAIEATIAYNEKAKTIFGQFARLNII